MKNDANSNSINIWTQINSINLSKRVTSSPRHHDSWLKPLGRALMQQNLLWVDEIDSMQLQHSTKVISNSIQKDTSGETRKNNEKLLQITMDDVLPANKK